MVVKVKDVLVELSQETPKAECGHGLIVGIGVLLFIVDVVVIYALMVG
jgi:hypothetical protein